MTALYLTDLGDEAATPLTRLSLGRSAEFSTGPSRTDADPLAPAGIYDERWLQKLLMRHPELMVLDRMEAGAGDVAPICRELPIDRTGGSVFLDLLGVTRTGRLVLTECKLWRNPQARREVVAQILEYAPLLRRWSFGDLTTRVKKKLGSSGANPIHLEAVKRWPDLDEAVFVDGLSRSLELGDFHLIIAGDGIRADLQAVASHLSTQGIGLARLSLLEIQLWTNRSGAILVVPHIPLKTEIIQQRVLIAQNGVPVEFEDNVQTATRASTIVEMEGVIDPDRAARKADNRAFWQRFIDASHFDHPDQPPPRHAGDNWVRIPLPEPLKWITAYRTTKGVSGLFMTFDGEEGQAIYDDFHASLGELREESGLELVAKVRKADPFDGEIGVYRSRSSFADEDEQLSWLADAANRLVNTIRPRLSLLVEETV